MSVTGSQRDFIASSKGIDAGYNVGQDLRVAAQPWRISIPAKHGSG
jgi:hypothetical protein